MNMFWGAKRVSMPCRRSSAFSRGVSASTMSRFFGGRRRNRRYRTASHSGSRRPSWLHQNCTRNTKRVLGKRSAKYPAAPNGLGAGGHVKIAGARCRNEPIAKGCGAERVRSGERRKRGLQRGSRTPGPPERVDDVDQAAARQATILRRLLSANQRMLAVMARPHPAFRAALQQACGRGDSSAVSRISSVSMKSASHALYRCERERRSPALWRVK
jgi:hypothetical protein